MVKKIAITATFLSVIYYTICQKRAYIGRIYKSKASFLCKKERVLYPLLWFFYNVLCMAVTSAASMISHQLLPGLYSAFLEEI